MNFDAIYKTLVLTTAIYALGLIVMGLFKASNKFTCDRCNANINLDEGHCKYSIKEGGDKEFKLKAIYCLNCSPRSFEDIKNL